MEDALSFYFQLGNGRGHNRGRGRGRGCGHNRDLGHDRGHDRDRTVSVDNGDRCYECDSNLDLSNDLWSDLDSDHDHVCDANFFCFCLKITLFSYPVFQIRNEQKHLHHDLWTAWGCELIQSLPREN